MIAYKFLRAGAVGPFSRVAWPVPGNGEPGDWVRVSGTLALCGNGVHACRAQDLPLWLFDELWEVELDGPVRLAPTHVVASGGRLRARIEEWNPGTAAAYAAACAERVHEPFASDAETWARSAAADEAVACADAACVAYIAAHAAGELGGPAAGAAERDRQAGWLAERLGLSAVA
jgi:hypothetical protein